MVEYRVYKAFCYEDALKIQKIFGNKGLERFPFAIFKGETLENLLVYKRIDRE